MEDPAWGLLALWKCEVLSVCRTVTTQRNGNCFMSCHCISSSVLVFLAPVACRCNMYWNMTHPSSGTLVKKTPQIYVLHAPRHDT